MSAAKDHALVYDQCERFLSRGRRSSVGDTLAELAGEATADDRADVYGRGGVIEALEHDIAKRLGKPAAVFMPSGTMAQQIALRIHCDRSGIATVAYHPTSHLELHEQSGLAELHGIRARLLGDRTRLMTPNDLEEMAGEVSTLLVELPQREIGGALPTWAELEALIAVARNRDMTIHLDGARLWECTPFYERTVADISALFDTVYVSFYKTLGGIAGAALAGPVDFLAEARIWQRRYGGNLVHLYPLVLSARAAMRTRADKVADYCRRAADVAKLISAVPGIRVTPDPPPTNMMHIYISAEPAAVERELLAIAEEERVMLSRSLRPTSAPGVAFFEASIGDAAFDLGNDELVRWFTRLAQASL